MTKVVTYLRVSTARQGQSGLGLEAQRAAVLTYLNGGKWSVIREFVEVESGSDNDRPQLAAAMALCRIYKAKLVIAKLDRLSRDASFLMGLKNAGIEFVAADMPDANTLTVGIMAVVAQEERRAISARTRAALAAAKARGVALGGYRGATVSNEAREKAKLVVMRKADEHARNMMTLIEELRRGGLVSQSAIARELTSRGAPKARGGTNWTATDVRNVAARG